MQGLSVEFYSRKPFFVLVTIKVGRPEACTKKRRQLLRFASFCFQLIRFAQLELLKKCCKMEDIEPKWGCDFTQTSFQIEIEYLHG